MFYKLLWDKKLFGGGKDVDAFIEFSPEELFSKYNKLSDEAYSRLEDTFSVRLYAT